MDKKKDLYFQIRVIGQLICAWSHIYSNGIRPDKSSKTRGEVQKYKEVFHTKLRSLSDKLRKGNYQFSEAEAVIQSKKKGKGIRPIVMADVNTRIIQRSILDVLQKQPFIQQYLNQHTSFGGISKEHRKCGGVGVEGAIKLLLETIKKGATYYIKSDIKEFFTKIPLKTVHSILEKNLSGQEEFIKLVQQATDLEIKNINDIKSDYIDLFDFNYKGTPQGCCLSSLFGNILLYEFDIETNKIATCIRFLDDFIILAPNKKAAELSLSKGKKALEKHGLSIYDPKRDKDKASEGSTNKEFEFLGVNVKDLSTSPSVKNRENLLNSVREIMNKSKLNFCKYDNKKDYDYSYIVTLTKISHKIEGWGNQYKFCDNRKILESMDKNIDELIENYNNSYFKRERQYKGMKPTLLRRLLGVQLLSDCKSNPI